MADLDTTSKRRSSVQLLATFILAVPLADGTISQADRQHIAWTYSGIAVAAPVSDPTVLYPTRVDLALTATLAVCGVTRTEADILDPRTMSEKT